MLWQPIHSRSFTSIAFVVMKNSVSLFTEKVGGPVCNGDGMSFAWIMGCWIFWFHGQEVSCSNLDKQTQLNLLDFTAAVLEIVIVKDLSIIIKVDTHDKIKGWSHMFQLISILESFYLQAFFLDSLLWKTILHNFECVEVWVFWIV